ILRSDDADCAVSKTIRSNDQNSTYYLELALTAEQAIADKYGNDTSDVLLIIANIAAKAYQEPSIGKNKIKLVVTRLIIIPNDQLNNSGQGLYDMSKAIGRWARRDNPVSDRDPKHYDVIALMRKTRGGGLASFNNICSRIVTSVFSDNGIGSWTTLAHEIGHK
ncbi:A disintegrin and metalloproteinase with thrombospondin motifs 1, partial [Exaiptasia diaphana]